MRLPLIISIFLSTALCISGCGGGGASISALTSAATGTATLTWVAPTDNVDGTKPANVHGYKIYYWSTQGTDTRHVDVGPTVLHHTLSLTPGTYHFVVTAYNKDKVESGYSNEAVKQVK